MESAEGVSITVSSKSEICPENISTPIQIFKSEFSRDMWCWQTSDHAPWIQLSFSDIYHFTGMDIIKNELSNTTYTLKYNTFQGRWNDVPYATWFVSIIFHCHETNHETQDTCSNPASGKLTLYVYIFENSVTYGN